MRHRFLIASILLYGLCAAAAQLDLWGDEGRFVEIAGACVELLDPSEQAAQGVVGWPVDDALCR